GWRHSARAWYRPGPTAGEPGLPLRPLEEPAPGGRRLPPGATGAARLAARDGRRLRGEGRSRGAEDLRADPRLHGGRSAGASVYRPGAGRRPRGERVSEWVDGDSAALAARGFRADRDRGDVEGAAGDRHARGRDNGTDPARRGRVSGRVDRGLRAAAG